MCRSASSKDPSPHPGRPPCFTACRMKRRIAVDLGVLRENRGLRLLISGELISGLGSQAALVAIPFQIYTLTHSPALVGLLGIVELIPIVVCSLFAGAAADRIERRRLMFAAQLAIAA